MGAEFFNIIFSQEYLLKLEFLFIYSGEHGTFIYRFPEYT